MQPLSFSRFTARLLYIGCVFLMFAAMPGQADTSSEELHMIAQQATQGDPDAQLLYGLAYLEGRYQLKSDPAKAAYWLLRAAREKQAYAEMEVGKLYMEGKGVTKDPEQAVYWWRKAANQDLPEAQYRLGKAYLEGMGVAKNPAKAVHWLTKAAENGNHDAEYELGKMYHEGYAVAQDKVLAQDWLSRAARSGHTKSINYLAVLKNLFKFTTLDYQQSAEVLIKKAQDGDPQAQYELGLRYESGAWDVNKDDKKALYWLTKAAHNGNHHAMAALAHIYELGQLGIEKDPKQADYWSKQSEKYR